MFKPTPGHRSGYAPAACLCEHCSELVLMMRCKARDEAGRQCGSWQGHRSTHVLLIDTTFLIALERVDRAHWGEIPKWAARAERKLSKRYTPGRPTLRYQPKRRERPA